MVWQRAGTVAVQNGSNTVIGTNVDFAASSRNGDSFVGPDGATYELANVASSTVISILPAYKGPTVSGAAYAIMPVQGYDKMLSDAFNNLNNQFGSKLAALGTTGNYETLPVSKGGTGATTQADARANLGLGNSATATIGTAPGNVMGVGAGGWLAASADPVTTINDYQTAFKSINPSTSGATDVGVQYGGMLTLSYSGSEGRLCQLFFGQVPSGVLKFRSGIATSSPIQTIYHTGNTTRAADGTLKAI